MRFIIPFKMDSVGRYSNLKLVIEYIQSNFKYDILVSEYDVESKIDISDYGVDHLFVKSESQLFNKSKCINASVKSVSDDQICICDSDILFDILPFNKGISDLVSGTSDFCLPYNNYVYNIPVKEFVTNGKSLHDSAKVSNLYSRSSIGGIILFNRDSFIRSGKYNEKFEGWGNEDYEFWLRINKLGFNVTREDGYLYHLNHFRFHPHRNMELLVRNRKELDKIKNMTTMQLKKYYRGDVE